MQRNQQKKIFKSSSNARLWPLSHEQYPRQHLPLAGNTMLQEIILRIYEIGVGHGRALYIEDKLPSKDEINL
jgi:mannose-1-phosphate guanylyltransferase